MNRRPSMWSGRIPVRIRRKSATPSWSGGVSWEEAVEEFDILLSIDIDEVMHALGAKAARNVSKRSKTLNGAITAKATRLTP